MIELIRPSKQPVMLTYEWDPQGYLLVDFGDAGFAIAPAHKMMELFLWEMQAWPTIQ